MTYQIDKDIPVPPLPKSAGRKQGKTRLKYPWPDMEVGDSILVPDVTLETLKTAALAWAKRQGLPWKFTARSNIRGVRIWRYE